MRSGEATCRCPSTTRLPGGPNSPVIKQINAQVANWPLIISEYRSSAQSARAAQVGPGRGPQAGRRAVHLGRDEHPRRVRPDHRHARSARRIASAAGRRPDRPHRPAAVADRAALACARPDEIGRAAADAPARNRRRSQARRDLRPQSTVGPHRRRGQRPRQADHRAPPAGRPPAVHPDRRRSRRLRGRRSGPDEPTRRARHPPGRRRDRSAASSASSRWR